MNSSGWQFIQPDFWSSYLLIPVHPPQHNKQLGNSLFIKIMSLCFNSFKVAHYAPYKSIHVVHILDLCHLPCFLSNVVLVAVFCRHLQSFLPLIIHNNIYKKKTYTSMRQMPNRMGFSVMPNSSPGVSQLTGLASSSVLTQYSPSV